MTQCEFLFVPFFLYKIVYPKHYLSVLVSYYFEHDDLYLRKYYAIMQVFLCERQFLIILFFKYLGYLLYISSRKCLDFHNFRNLS